MTTSPPVHYSEPIIPDSESVFDKLHKGTIASDKLLSMLKSYRLLPQLLRELIIDEAIANITCSSEETINACKHFHEKNQLSTDQNYQDWLIRNQLNAEQLENLIARDLRIEKFKQVTWGHKLESYFLQRKGQLDRVIYSLIRSKDFALVQELYFRIQEGEQSFAELAQRYSQGVEAQTGGFIGPIELSVPHPVLAQKIAASQPGQLLSPMRLNDWIVIARLEKFIPAQLDEFTRQRLLNELFENWLREKMLSLSNDS